MIMSLALTATCEIVTLAFPEFVRVTLFALEVPALTLPKARLAGLEVRDTEAARPVPLRATLVGESGALLEMLTAPLTVPAVLGANPALKDAL